MTINAGADASAASRLAAITTRWSVLHDAADDGAAARQAMVMRYEKAIRGYCRAIVGVGPDAEDLAQDVLVRLLSGDFAGADPARGRFRDLLKTAIRNMVRGAWRRSKVRRTVDFEIDRLSQDGDAAGDAVWAACWRDELVQKTLAALSQFERCHPESLALEVLRLRAEHENATSTELARLLFEATGRSVRPDAFRQKLRRARLIFTDLLLAEIGRGLRDPTPERLEDELIALGLLEHVRPYLPEDWTAPASDKIKQHDSTHGVS